MDNIIGITARDWFDLLKANHFNIAPSYWLKAAYITVRSLSNSRQKRLEDRLYAKAIEETRIEYPPIFIIGHWRSGTTFLHNVLARDKQFSFPNLFEANNPQTFLSRQKIFEKRLQQYRAQKRRMDNIRIALDSPIEEEFILAVLSLTSPLVGWMFPKRQDFYDRFLTFKEATDQEREKWINSFQYFLKKATLKYQKPMLLKSPTNTCKIKILLSMFPNAKFIHIHRNPYAVFKSTRHLYQTAIKATAMQHSNSIALDDYIIAQYSKMYDSYFEEKPLIPDRQFVEIAYESFEQNPIPAIEKIYQQLNLKIDEQTKQEIKEYLKDNSSYQKNKYSSLETPIRDKIYQNWRRSFETWGYPY